MKKNKLIGISAIAVNILTLLYETMLGASAGSTSYILFLIGLVLTIFTIVKTKNTITWIALGTSVLALLNIFF